MKVLSTPVLILFLILTSCKTDKKAEVQEAAEEPGILDKVAQAHGYEHWDSVKEIRFTFNVDRDTTHFERSWIWKPGSSEVMGISAGDTVTYKRNAVDSTLSKLDGAFINDKFWFLAPFQLVWDRKNFSYEHTGSVSSPLAGKKMQKLTIVYGNEGGYTPGDAYDFYLDEHNRVQEWTFRRANKAAPGSDASWEGYETHGGMQLSTMHKLGGGATLYFTGVEVINR